MAGPLSPKRGHRGRKAAGGLALVVVLVLTLVASASAIVQPANIGDATWNAPWDAAAPWPPAADPGDWPLPAANPNLVAECGIDIGVIVDRSGSIAIAGQADAYREGLNTLIDAFDGSPTNMGIWSFANDASDTDPVTYPWHQMADLSVAGSADSLRATVDAIPIEPGFGTSWEEGMRAPLQASVDAGPPEPDVWLVVTDGQPTIHADDNGSGSTTNNDDMAGGIASANLLKASDGGTKVLAVGVGPGVAEAGLQLISGPTEFDPAANGGLGNFTVADYITTSFADLASNLENFVVELCASSVTVTKEVSTLAAPTTYAAAPGWAFDAVNSTEPPAVTPASGVTDGAGQIEFTLDLPTSETVTITETQQANFQLVSRTCTLGEGTFPFTETADGVQLTLAPGQDVSCTFRNQPVFIDLSVAKTDGKTTTAPGAINDYTITYDNAADATATATEVVLNETVPLDTVFVAASSPGWDCNGAAAGQGDGAVGGTACTLSVGDLTPAAPPGTTHFVVQVINPVGAGVSTITNTVTITGTGNERDLADQTSTDVDTLDAAPVLTVDKDDDGVTAVTGGVIEYDIAYSNDGNEAASNVSLSETVPANTTFESDGSDPGWSCADGDPAGTVCTLAVGTVPAQSTDSVTFVVRVAPSVPDGVEVIDNTVAILGDGCEGPCDEDDEDTPLEDDPPPPVVPRSLPQTGQNVQPLVGLAGALLILGGSSLLMGSAVTQRRRPLAGRHYR